MTSPRAGQPAAPEDLIDVSALVAAYYDLHPDPAIPEQRVSFGTSGHRGSSLTTTFNEDHIIATSQAICEYRASQGIIGPLFLGGDTHALSEPATTSALEVFAANDVTVLIDSRDGYTPTPALSRAILAYNADRSGGLADGVVVTPSHNPPSDGGFKYNPPDGGPAGTDITGADSKPRQRAARRRMPGGATSSVGPGSGRRNHAALRLSGRVRRRVVQRARPGRNSHLRPAHRGRSARRGQRRLLGRNRVDATAST